MHGQGRRALFGRVKSPAVGNNYRVGSYFRKIRKIVLHEREVAVFCEYICRNVYFFAQSVCERDCRSKLFTREVIGKRAEGKILSAYVHGVRAEIERGFKFCVIARGG